jgi:putative tryptophan/tyrosine transport system substrate-binding protein
VIANPHFADSETHLQAAQTAARSLGQKLLVLNASTDGEINSAFKSIVERQASALVVLPDPFLTSRAQQIVALAAYQSIPAIYAWPDFTDLGGLMSYGTSLADAYHEVGVYTAKVLKGAKPAELPVQEAVKVELVLNVKTAKSLGINFPLSLLGRADRVIE